jgi:signal peptidase I
MLLWVCAATIGVSAAASLDLVRVSGSSMERTLHSGDVLFIARVRVVLRYQRFRTVLLSRGRIVVFSSPGDESLAVKRIVAVGGDRVRISRGRLIVNGVETREPYATDSDSDVWPAAQGGSVVVPERRYFVLGDNRTAASDSRVWGTIPEFAILGIVLARRPTLNCPFGN